MGGGYPFGKNRFSFATAGKVRPELPRRGSFNPKDGFVDCQW